MYTHTHTYIHLIGNLPPSGQYEVDVSALEPGPHLFIINFDDGYGKSLTKIYPFSIGTGNNVISIHVCSYSETPNQGKSLLRTQCIQTSPNCTKDLLRTNFTSKGEASVSNVSTRDDDFTCTNRLLTVCTCVDVDVCLYRTWLYLVCRRITGIVYSYNVATLLRWLYTYTCIGMCTVIM